MADTIRLRCLKKIRDNLADMVEGMPESDPYSLTFTSVRLEPLGDADTKKQYMAAVVPGAEIKSARFPLMDVLLNVVVEVRMTLNKGDGGAQENLERVLGDVQRKLREDPTLGGLAIDLREVRNETETESDLDKTLEAYIFCELQYRHLMDDPRAPV